LQGRTVKTRPQVASIVVLAVCAAQPS
jgi:hypothetical protein